jgi:hypothetical protein
MIIEKNKNDEPIFAASGYPDKLKQIPAEHSKIKLSHVFILQESSGPAIMPSTASCSK